MSRRLGVGVGLLGIVVIGILVALLVRTGGGPDPGPTPSQSASVAVSQASYLVAVRDDSGEITDAVLMAFDQDSDKGSSLSLQPGLGVDINKDGAVTLGEVGPGSPQYINSLVADQLGVNVSGGLIMDRLAFAGLVDAVGGVVVNVAAPITERGADGKVKILVRPGNRRLYGPAAAAYVTTLSPGESQAARMARFDTVWKQIIGLLPPNSDRVRSIVGSLGSSARMSMTAEVAAVFLTAYQAAQSAGNVVAATLPVTGIGVGATELFTLAPAKAQPVIVSLFGPSMIVAGKNGALPRVRVLSVGAGPAALSQVKQQFARVNLAYVWGGSTVSAKSTTVYVAHSAEAASVGNVVAGALELPNSVVSVSTANTIGVDATVFVAADIFVASSSLPSASQ